MDKLVNDLTEMRTRLIQIAGHPMSPVEARLWDTMNFLVLSLKENLSKPPTTESRTRTYPLDVDSRELETDDTTRPTPASSQSDRAGTESGRVERDCKCVAPNLDLHSLTTVGPQGMMVNKLRYRCMNCRAFVWYVRTPVPVAVLPLSTSVRQGLNKSAETLAEGSAKSQSNELPKGWWANGYEQRYGRSLGPWHWHSGHQHPDGNVWHDHEGEETP